MRRSHTPRRPRLRPRLRHNIGREAVPSTLLLKPAPLLPKPAPSTATKAAKLSAQTPALHFLAAEAARCTSCFFCWIVMSYTRTPSSVAMAACTGTMGGSTVASRRVVGLKESQNRLARKELVSVCVLTPGRRCTGLGSALAASSSYTAGEAGRSSSGRWRVRVTRAGSALVTSAHRSACRQVTDTPSSAR
ncbi:hypothetical protein TSOC_000205 [Tetrabaena socialis]|uniref:Uncharacterized protein n=1 Tax=Tetrabaena socialis TaxID=47790 RepID=A0A2J8AJY5_9CHLO|nr:hypothetical protein TSOC_000205 [Tetrabaena socialis]|eukprot:PNH12835.1 hypothetical protein TSOC_000205 [Tetrabaena socialis]